MVFNRSRKVVLMILCLLAALYPGRSAAGQSQTDPACASRGEASHVSLDVQCSIRKLLIENLAGTETSSLSDERFSELMEMIEGLPAVSRPSDETVLLRLFDSIARSDAGFADTGTFSSPNLYWRARRVADLLLRDLANVSSPSACSPTLSSNEERATLVSAVLERAAALGLSGVAITEGNDPLDSIGDVMQGLACPPAQESAPFPEVQSKPVPLPPPSGDPAPPASSAPESWPNSAPAPEVRLSEPYAAELIAEKSPPTFDPGQEPEITTTTDEEMADPAVLAGIFSERRYLDALNLLHLLTEPFETDLKRTLIEEYLDSGTDGAGGLSPLDLRIDPGSCFEDLGVIGELTRSLLEPAEEQSIAASDEGSVPSLSRAEYGITTASSVMQLSTCSAGMALPILDELFRAVLNHLPGEQFVIREGTPITDYRETVLLEITEKKGGKASICSGALVSSCQVLTAAHCMLSKKQLADGGTVAVKVLGPGESTPGAMTRTFSRSGDPLIHPVSDLAVINLSQKVKKGPSYLPVQLKSLTEIEKEVQAKAEMERKVNPGIYLKILGFGQTTDKTTHVLRAGHMFFRGYDSFTAVIDPEAEGKKKTFQAILMNPVAPRWSALCPGDSGGPILYDNKIVGVTHGANRSLGLRTVCVKDNSDKSLTWWLPTMEELRTSARKLLKDETFSKNAAYYPPWNQFQSLKPTVETDPKLEILATSYHMAQETCRNKEGFRLPKADELRTQLVKNITTIYNKNAVVKFDPAAAGSKLPVVSGGLSSGSGEPLDLSDPAKELWLPAESVAEVFGYWVATDRPAKDPRKSKQFYEVEDFLTNVAPDKSYARAYAGELHFKALMVGEERRTRRSPGEKWATDDDAFFPIVKLHNIPLSRCERAITTDIAASLYHANQEVKDKVAAGWIEKNISNELCKDLQEVSLENEEQAAAPLYSSPDVL